MRKIVVVIVAVALAATLTACGGGSKTETPATTAPASTAPAAPAAAAGAAGQQAIADLSPTETVTYAPLIAAGVSAPAAVAQRVKSKQPFILVFYDESQPVTEDQKAAIATVQKRYRGLADLVTFNVGKYVTTSADGTIKVNQALLKDKNAADVAALAESLKITSTPYIVIVDKNGYVTFRAKGYVDDGQLEREVLRVGE